MFIRPEKNAFPLQDIHHICRAESHLATRTTQTHKTIWAWNGMNHLLETCAIWDFFLLFFCDPCLRQNRMFAFESSHYEVAPFLVLRSSVKASACCVLVHAVCQPNWIDACKSCFLGNPQFRSSRVAQVVLRHKSCWHGVYRHFLECIFVDCTYRTVASCESVLRRVKAAVESEGCLSGLRKTRSSIFLVGPMTSPSI